MPRITSEEWLDELAKFSARKDEGLTSAEWAEKLGVSTKYVIQILGKAKVRGWLAIGKQTRESLDGRTYRSTVYRIVQKKK